MTNETNILNMLVDSSLLMGAWLLLACAFHTWGSFLSRLLGIQFSGNKKLLANIWMGWVVGIFFFAVYQLFFPINAFASSLFYLPAIIYFFYKYYKKIPDFTKNIGRAKLLAIILIAFSAAIIAVQQPLNYDTGFYHLPSIKWLNEYHIIKGLANLHSRFGFNQLYFLYSASLNFYPFFEEYAFHAANSFLYVLFSAGCILGGTAIDLLLLCLFFFLPMPYYWIGNPTPDMASTLLQIVTFRYFLKVIRDPHSSVLCTATFSSFVLHSVATARRHPWRLPLKEKGVNLSNPQPRSSIGLIAFAAVLAAVMVMVKLSNIVFALGLGAITLILNQNKHFEIEEKKTIKKAFIFIGIFVCIWILRGYIQSGYPLFPSTVGRINFDWAIPEAYAKHQAESVYAGSRSVERTFDSKSPLLENWSWLDYWFKYYFFDSEKYFTEDIFSNIYVMFMLLLAPITMFNWGIGSIVLCGLTILFIVFWYYKMRTNSELWKNTKYLFYLLIVELFSILFWFFVAPVPRFANGIFIIFFVTSFLMIQRLLPEIKYAVNLKKCMIFYPVIMLLWGFSSGCDTEIFRVNGMAVLDKVETKIYITESGLKIEIPAKGSLCWIINVMSTPEPKPWLSLRKDSVEDGFCMRKSQE